MSDQVQLSILCVSKGEPSTLPLLWGLESVASKLHAELLLVADGQLAYDRLTSTFRHSRLLINPGIRRVHSLGYIESVLDEAVTFTTGTYVLRIDDDESISPPMIDWLQSGVYTSEPNWKFSRAHLCLDTDHYITNPPLWPDHQTRLSLRSLSGGRSSVHSGSPHGGGVLAPAVINHHKFLVKSLQDRMAILSRYERLQTGAGSNFRIFSVPELETTMQLDVRSIQSAYDQAAYDHHSPLQLTEVVPT